MRSAFLRHLVIGGSVAVLTAASIFAPSALAAPSVLTDGDRPAGVAPFPESGCSPSGGPVEQTMQYTRCQVGLTYGALFGFGKWMVCAGGCPPLVGCGTLFWAVLDPECGGGVNPG